MANWSVTYERITPASAEHGEPEDSGFICEDVTLRQAVSSLHGASVIDTGRWFATDYAEPDYQDCSETYYAIHPPATITPASYARVKRLLTK